MHWLGDLPNAGYSTARERHLSDAMMFFLRAAERERPMLLMYVIEGEELFTSRMRKAWQAFKVSDEEIAAVWRYLKLLAGPDPQKQLGQLLAIRPFASTLTEEQIRAIQKAAGQ
jgi:hypothetical protein